MGLNHLPSGRFGANGAPGSPSTSWRTTWCAGPLDRYIRVRARHKFAREPWLWIGQRGHMSPSGIRQVVWDRAAQAGLEGVHPHALKHTFCHQWLAKGGTEGDLMKIVGWQSQAMARRYAS